MQYFTTTLFCFTTLTVSCVSAAALPVDAPKDVSLASKTSTLCVNNTRQYIEAMREESSAFALQLVASPTSDEELGRCCSGLQDGAFVNWEKEGLAVDKIEETVCSANKTRPSATSILPKVVQATTRLFTHQLLNSFAACSDTTGCPFRYLCEKLDHISISGFLLDDNSIINATCKLSGTNVPPQAFSVSPKAINPVAIRDYQTASTNLYVYQYVASADTPTAVRQLCVRAPQNNLRWTNLQLNAQLVQTRLCDFSEPVPVAEAIAQAHRSRSEKFLVVMKYISTEPGYLHWLCQNLDADAMDSVALDGAFIKQSVCKAASEDTN